MFFRKAMGICVSILFIALTLEVFYGFFWELKALLLSGEKSIYDTFSLIVTVALVLFLVLQRNMLVRFSLKINSFFGEDRFTHMAFFICAFGLLVRVLYVLIFPSTPSSDGSNYLSLALNLIHGEPYKIGGSIAYWPPGYPFFMIVWLFFFNEAVAVAVSNTVIYVVSSMLLYFSLREALGLAPAKLGLLFFALWPNMVALYSVPSKEMFLVLISSIILYLFVFFRGLGVLCYIFFGLLWGMASLTQPGMMLMFLAVPMSEFLGGKSLKSVILGSAFIIFGMVTVIAPWSLRNYAHFNKRVLITSNGGSNFYRANNPLADGRYQHCGEIDFSHLSELEQSAASYDAAFEWIRNHPTDFFLLSIKKQLIFLGDDGAGFYSSLKRGGGSDSEIVYFLARGVGNVVWFLLWIFIFIGTFRRKYQQKTVVVWFAELCILYLWAVHSFFESGAKYHIPLSLFIILLAASAITLPRVDLRDSREIENY